MAQTGLVHTIGPVVARAFGEFAFVLYAAALSAGIFDARTNALFATVVILSMAASPLLLAAADRFLRAESSMAGIDIARDL